MTERDARLVERAVAGSDEAFDELVVRHRSRLCRAAARILKCSEAADDVAQEALVRAYVGLPTLKKPEAFGAWVVGIAENLCRMRLRGRREGATSQEVVEAVAAKPDLQPSDLRARMGSLAPGTRQAAELYFLQGKGMLEVSLLLGISLSAVKSRIRDARKGLQKEDSDMRTKTKREPDAFDIELQRRLELARWFREFGKMASSGIPVLQIMDLLSQGPYSRPVKEATVKLRSAVLEGKSMADTMRYLPALRTPETLSLVHAGEVGGMIDRTADVLADWIDVGSSQREIELSFWLRTLGDLIDAGVPLEAALSWGIEYPANAGLKATLKRIAEANAEGKTIAPIVRAAVDELPASVRFAMVAGESAGCLGFALRFAGDELAARVCERLTGNVSDFHRDEHRQRFAAEVAKLLPNEPPDTRRAAVVALGSLGTADAALHAANGLEDSEREVRLAAVQALARLNAKECAEQIVACLDDSEAGVRLAAVHALSALDARHLAPRIIQAIHDPDLPTAKAAMDTVEKMGPVDLLTSYAIEVLSGEWCLAKFFAVDILRNHPVPEAIPVLIESLDGPPHIRTTSAVILAGFGRAEGAPALREAVVSIWGITVRWAAEALESLKDRGSAELIRQAVGNGTLSEEWLARADRLAEE